jgi:hypothetical protein
MYRRFFQRAGCKNMPAPIKGEGWSSPYEFFLSVGAVETRELWVLGSSISVLAQERLTMVNRSLMQEHV